MENKEPHLKTGAKTTCRIVLRLGQGVFHDDAVLLKAHQLASSKLMTGVLRLLCWKSANPNVYTTIRPEPEGTPCQLSSFHIKFYVETPSTSLRYRFQPNQA